MSADNVTRREVLVAQVLDHCRFAYEKGQVVHIARQLAEAGDLFSDTAIVAKAVRLGLARLEGWQPMLPTGRDLRIAAGLWLARLARPILEHEEHFEELTRRVMGLSLQEPPLPEDDLVVPVREAPFDLAEFRTVGDFLAKPDGSHEAAELEAFEKEGLEVGRMQELATILAERRLLAVLRRVLEMYRPLMPAELAAAVPPATSEPASPEQDAIDEFLWEHVNSEVAGEVDFVARWMTRLALLPFADTLLKVRPEAGKLLAVHQALAAARKERDQRVEDMLGPALARLARLFPDAPLSRERVPRLLREMLTHAMTPEGLQLVCELYADERFAAMLQPEALSECNTRMLDWFEQVNRSPRDFGSSLVSLVRALDEARARDGREWFVSTHSDGLRLFSEENWTEFLLFAFTRNPNLPCVVTVRRIEHERRASDPDKPVLSVAGMVLHGDSVALVSAQSVKESLEGGATADRMPSAPEDVRYMSMRDLVPGFLFLVDTLPDKTRTLH